MMNAIGFKNEGNKFFASRKFDDAIRCYTKAIVSISLFSLDFYFFVQLSSNGMNYTV